MEGLLMRKEHYAIEKVGYKNIAYIIKKVTATGLIIPVDGKRYKTLDKAIEAAKELDIDIKKIGNIYEIV